MTQNYGLELNNVEPGDEGQYSCQLDVFGETQTALHNLTVLGEIIFVFFTTTFTVKAIAKL